MSILKIFNKMLYNINTAHLPHHVQIRSLWFSPGSCAQPLLSGTRHKTWSNLKDRWMWIQFFYFFRTFVCLYFFSPPGITAQSVHSSHSGFVLSQCDSGRGVVSCEKVTSVHLSATVSHLPSSGHKDMTHWGKKWHLKLILPTAASKQKVKICFTWIFERKK